MIERLVEYLGDHGCVAEPEAVAYLARQADPQAHLAHLLSSRKELPFYLTLPVLRQWETEGEVPFGLSPEVEDVLKQLAVQPANMIPALPATIQPLSPQPGARAADYAAEVALVKDSGGATATSGQIQDFVRYFNDRYETLARLLRKRREVSNAVPIKHAHRQGKEVQLIGVVQDVAKSPNGHLFLELEDDTGSATVLIHKSTPNLVGEGQTLLPDEVVGVVASLGREADLLIAKEIVRPDLPFAKPRTRADVDLCAAFLSDVHVGSRTFLPKPFARMVDWLHGRSDKSKDRALAARIKYLVLAGDVVDGVGIYPGQEASLDLPQIHKQYERLAELLRGLPEHVHVVIQPGNHDAVRPTEPQPPFDREIQSYFHGLETTFVSNPSTFTLHGVEVLSYHGFSMIDFATRIPGLSMDKPMPIMQRMLRSRHLAPTYGAATPLSPEEKDFLVVDRVPDIFVTGHVHVNGLDQYRGVTMINAGTWQDQTDYQRMHNLLPTPARVPVVDLGTLNASLVDFSV